MLSYNYSVCIYFGGKPYIYVYCRGKLVAENYSREFPFGPNPLFSALSPCPFPEGQGPLWRS